MFYRKKRLNEPFFLPDKVLTTLNQKNHNKNKNNIFHMSISPF